MPGAKTEGLRTAVIGGGSCGLALARGLHQCGLTVEVFERSAALDSRGFGFLLLANGCHSLRQLGIDPGSRLGQPIASVRMVNSTGATLAHYPLQEAVAVSRSRLLDCLMEGVPPDLIHFQHQLEGFEWEDGLARNARFSNGLRHRADVFLAADGMGSQCRKEVGTFRGKRSGRVKEIVASVNLPWLDSQLGSCFLKVLDPEGGLGAGLVPLGDGNLIWFVQFDTQRFLTPRQEQIQTFLRTHLQTFPDPVLQVINATDFRQVHLWHPVDADPLARWSRGNLVLAGDAAHPLLPFTSQGVNTALDDAVLLSRLLCSCDGPEAVPRLLDTYERERRPQLLPHVRDGRAMAEAFVEPGPGKPRLPLLVP